MTPTGFAHKFNHASALESTGRAGGKDTFDISRAPIALGAEAALAPQNALAYDAFGMIVGWLDVLALDKCPQMFSMLENSGTFPRQ